MLYDGIELVGVVALPLSGNQGQLVYLLQQDGSNDPGLYEHNGTEWAKIGAGGGAVIGAVGSGGIDNYTSLMIHGGAIEDASPVGHAITNNGVTIGPGQGMVCEDALIFTGTDFIELDFSDTFNFGTEPFTVDFRVNTSTSSGIPIHFGGEWLIHWNPLFYWSHGAAWDLSTNSLPLDQWVHVGIVRDAENNIVIYFNGVEQIKVPGRTEDYTGAGTEKLRIGYSNTYATTFVGKIEQFRVSKGIARWTEDFTPNTLPYYDSDINPFAVANDIIPDQDNIRNLGSPTKMWKDVYIGPGSLYINNHKVLEEITLDGGTSLTVDKVTLLQKTTLGNEIEAGSLVYLGSQDGDYVPGFYQYDGAEWRETGGSGAADVGIDGLVATAINDIPREYQPSATDASCAICKVGDYVIALLGKADNTLAGPNGFRVYKLEGNALTFQHDFTVPYVGVSAGEHTHLPFMEYNNYREAYAYGIDLSRFIFGWTGVGYISGRWRRYNIIQVVEIFPEDGTLKTQGRAEAISGSALYNWYFMTFRQLNSELYGCVFDHGSSAQYYPKLINIVGTAITIGTGPATPTNMPDTGTGADISECGNNYALVWSRHNTTDNHLYIRIYTRTGFSNMEYSTDVSLGFVCYSQHVQQVGADESYMYYLVFYEGATNTLSARIVGVDPTAPTNFILGAEQLISTGETVGSFGYRTSKFINLYGNIWFTSFTNSGTMFNAFFGVNLGDLTVTKGKIVSCNQASTQSDIVKFSGSSFAQIYCPANDTTNYIDIVT